MAAKRYVTLWEASFKLNSGIEHKHFEITSGSYDEGVKRMTTAVIKHARRMEGLFLGCVMLDSNVAWRAAIPAFDVAN